MRYLLSEICNELLTCLCMFHIMIISHTSTLSPEEFSRALRLYRLTDFRESALDRSQYFVPTDWQKTSCVRNYAFKDFCLPSHYLQNDCQNFRIILQFYYSFHLAAHFWQYIVDDSLLCSEKWKDLWFSKCFVILLGLRNIDCTLCHPHFVEGREVYRL